MHKTLAVALLLAAFPAMAQDRGWPAHYHNQLGTPCCSIGKDGDKSHWDCKVISSRVGSSLEIGSVVAENFPNGMTEVPISSIFVSETPDYVLCTPGCLFVPYVGS